MESPDRHTLPRLFIGPLPERVLQDAQQSAAKHANGTRRLFGITQNRQSPSGNDEPVEELINHYAYAFHLKLGGSEGDWNEERENKVKFEMSRRWRESPWGRLWRGRRDSLNAPHGHWVLPNDAGSFQVGEFLGLNTYAEPASPITPEPICASPTEEGPSGSASRPTPFDRPSSTTHDTFMTARSHLSLEPEPVPLQSSSFLLEGSPVVSADELPASTSTTGLIRVAPDADRPPAGFRTYTGTSDGDSKLKPALKARALAPAKSDGAINGPTDTRYSFDQGKGKAKKVFVRLPDDPSPSPPAPPIEVLQRSGGEIQDTSAAAAEDLQAATSSSAAPIDAPDEYDDAKMRGENLSLLSGRADISSLWCPEFGPCRPSVASCRYGLRSDRMVVRVAYCKDDSFGSHFDEAQDRCTRDMQFEDWAEFMVVWRGHRLELYNNFVRFSRFPCSASEL